MLTPMMLAPCLARVSRWGQSERSLQEVSGKSMWSQKVTYVGIDNDNSIIIVSSADLLPAPGEDVAPGVGEGGGGVVVALDVDSVARRTRLQLV